MAKHSSKSSKHSKEKKREESEESEEEEESDDDYTVEKILDKKSVKGKGNRRNYLYLVKWEGYPSTQNTWEPTSNLRRCQQLVKEFNDKYNKKKNDTLRRKSLQRLEEEEKKKSKKRKQEESDESRSPKRRKSSRKHSQEENGDSEEQSSGENDNDSEFNPDKEEEETSQSKSKTKTKKTNMKPQSPKSPRTPRTPRSDRSLRSSRIFQDDNIVVDDPHFSLHQTAEERRQIQRYLEKLKDLSKSSTIKLLNPSQLLAAQSLTSKLILRLSNNLNQSLSSVMNEDDENDDDKKEKNQIEELILDQSTDMNENDTLLPTEENEKSEKQDFYEENDLSISQFD